MDQPGSIRKYRVLLAEAEPVARVGLEAVIAGHEALEVCGAVPCARKAREMCEHLQPDVLVLDFTLPEGVSLIKDMAKWSPRTRVVVFSALADARSVQRALTCGALGYVSRRDPLNSVVFSVLAALEGRRHMGPSVESMFWDTVAAGRLEWRDVPAQNLTEREMQVFLLIGRGVGTREVAEELRVSVKTVESYRGRIKEKLGARNGRELLCRALQFASQTQNPRVSADEE